MLTRDYLTNPKYGIQTAAGNALTSVYNQYQALVNSGQQSPELIQNTIDTFEQIRSDFEGQVRSFGVVAMNNAGGFGAIESINKWARQLIADRQAELAQLTTGAGAAGSGSASFGSGLSWILILVVLILMFLHSRRS